MVKVISLSEEAYKMLKKIKKEGMSFSDVIIENIGNSKFKTENMKDLIEWVEKLPKKRRKVKINIDEIIYGVSK
ncbi:antitoxin VapB family protein [Candidatus Woesearchaeota archaeon]|nr:antitoxin VapB family protein [Candidatus Woesearchaeota archaeon]